MRKWLYYNHFRMGVFFIKRFSYAEDCAENCDWILKALLVPFESFHMLYGFVVNTKIALHELLRIMHF